MKIAIVKLSALGDIVHAMVVLQFIKKHHPDAIIDWVVEAGFSAVLDNNPDINQIHAVNLKQAKRQKSLRLFFTELKKLKKLPKYDVVIDMQGLIKSALVARLIPSKQTWGFDKNSIRESFAAKFYSHHVNIAYNKNTIKRNIKVACQPLNIAVSNDEIIDKTSFLFPDKGLRAIKQPYIVFVIGSTWESRNYPKEKFVQVAQALKTQCVVAWGNHSEKEKATWMAEQSAYIDILPVLNLAELMHVVKNARLLIGNDTGPTHMAWGLNTPSITLFGPTPVNRVYQTPINKVLASDSNVNHFNLDKYDYSIAEISVESIVKEAKELLYLA